MVAARPSSSFVRAVNWNHSVARLVSSARRGLTVGLGRVPADLAFEPRQASDEFNQLADRDLGTDAEVDRLGAVVPFSRQDDPIRCIVDVQELARRRARSPHLDLVVATFARLDALLDQGRDDVRACGIEVVARPIQVHRDQVDDVEPVLGAIGLALDEQHLLGEPVRCVGLLRIPVPQVHLAERHGRELRIRAHGPDLDELRDTGQTRPLHELDAHHGVLVEEPAGIVAVRADAADNGRQVDHQVRPRVGQRATHAVAGAQIVGDGPRHDHVARPRSLQAAHDGPTQEPGATGHHDPAAAPETGHPVA